MTLDDLYMQLPAGSKGKRVAPMGEMPEYRPLTLAQIAQRQEARKAQVGKPKRHVVLAVPTASKGARP